MAALLRHGARRLGGSVVQRTRAAFTTRAGPGAGAEEGRPLTPEHMRPRPPKDLEDCSREIQYRKEELYELISLMQQTSLPKSYQNLALVKFLSVQVKPRPQDSYWRWLRQSKKSGDAIEKGILVSICILGYEYWRAVSRGKEVKTQSAKKQEQ